MILSARFYSELVDALPLDTAFVSPKALATLPNASILAQAGSILEELNSKLQAIAGQFSKVLEEADSAVAETKVRWEEKRKVIEETYEKLLRELQKSNIDGAEFIRLRSRLKSFGRGGRRRRP